jgi:acyl-CoA thioesterase FadM
MLLEEVAQWSIIAHLGRFGITREISVRYLRAVPTNSDIAVEGQIISKDEKNIVLRSTVNNSDGALLVEGESSWLLVTPSVIAKIAAVDEMILQDFLSKYSKKGKREGLNENG